MKRQTIARIVAIIFAVLMITTAQSITASAATNTSAQVSSKAEASRGEEITFTVGITNGTGVQSILIIPSYDSSTFELVSGAWTLSGGLMSDFSVSTGDGAIAFNPGISVNGTVLTFKLKAKADASFGTHTVSAEVVITDSTGTSTLSTRGTSVQIKCNHSYGSWTKVNDTTHKRTCSICQKDETANHSWNGGTITKAASCKETGVKTYTCTVCNATKTETIAKTTDHKYGSWTKVNDTTHKHTCSVCSKEETASHSWDGGKVTKQPTCKEEGVKIYTCTACNATKTESITKTNTHSYGSWTKVNDSTHKHTCSVCSKEETANHSWDGGKITKQPTCKEEGVKTFTCSACNGAKTEPVAKTTDHKYGSWTKVNDTTHKHTCSVCSKEETANHTWNSGTVTKKATCKEAGVKTYTCTACNATKTESIAKLTTHTYDHACDTDCNVCGATHTITHNYKTSWSKDKANHWHECSVCKDKKDVTAHTPGAEATETTAQTCTTCGYVIKAALGHKHNYATTWTTDEAGHWYACSGCEEKSSYAAHGFENDCDKDCSICGFTRETEHKFAEVWTSDATNHWHVCSGCGLKQDEATHEPGAEATATTAQTCTICGYEIAPALGSEETTAPTESGDATTPTVPTDKIDSEDGSFPWWIIIIVAVVAAGGVIAVIVIMKKKA